MKCYLIAVGHRMPAWVTDGFNEYARRLNAELRLELCPLAPAPRRRQEPPDRAIADEGRRQLAAVPEGALVVALDEHGQDWSTVELARRVSGWLAGGRDIALLVGGADGLSEACLQRAELRWSLSPLTLPHGLVRVVVAEQLYRAWSVLNHHPYHRA